MAHDDVKFFVRRDMPDGLMARIGEIKRDGHPFTEVIQAVCPVGHITVFLDKNGTFMIEVHPDQGNALPIIGGMDTAMAIVTKVGDYVVDEKSRGKMN